MRKKGFFSILIVLSIISGIIMASINVYADITLPDGVLKVFKVVDDGNTREETWKNKTDGVISLPNGEDFTGGRNHAVYHLYTDDIKVGDVFYTHWVMKIKENSDVSDDEVVFGEDPAWLSEYTSKGQGEVEVFTGAGADNAFLAEDYEDLSYYYEDFKPGEYTVVGRGYKITDDYEDVNDVQWRLHSEATVEADVKYLIITNKPMNFQVDKTTGEIVGVTTEGTFVEATPAPTQEKTAAPETTAAKVTTAAPKTTAPSNTTAGNSSNGNDNDNMMIIIIIVVAAVVVAGGAVTYIIIKKKKK